MTFPPMVRPTRCRPLAPSAVLAPPLRSRALWLLLSLTLLVPLAACGGTPASRSAPSGAGAAARDAGVIGGNPAADADGVDAAVDPEADAPVDAGADADAPVDAAADTETDASARPAELAAPAPDRARLTRLTEPGCCTQPWWSADGRRVLFIDRPAPDAPTGIYAASLDAPGAAPELVTETVAYYSDDMAYRFELEGEVTRLLRLADGEAWTVPAGGRPVSISPGGGRILWQISPQDVAFERRTTRVWVADIDGSDAREIGSLPRGSVSGWITDDLLLARGRDSLQAEEDILWAMSVADGGLREIARAERLRGELVSPGGSWVAWYVARQTDPVETGIWLAPTSGGAARRLDPARFGGYQWQDDGRLLVVPQRAEQGSHRIYAVDAASLAVLPLTEPAETPFKIANGDWAVAPDGRRVAFVESRDKAIWVLELPAPDTPR